ncbi:hypothetical protein CLUG_02749 [Clavispora lusitaniae ATCC 42720]|uniref:Transmembrane protein n=1 Tax=Clavispora lusitaniae (strain ATCC 42720) TaxID=306902 RepID=C4Y2I6_CLAL4|nr:uncharacterized protein CLUG_02749 [Clavispora lusitaniae ATCC 42720]EEQ38623.1 hypothetical protein CLUG_02749 [Clavispora lusitaniae ATCC 42720]
MEDTPITLPHWVVSVSGWSALFSALIIFISIFMHLLNYRKPFQQRLMIRIQLIVPMFALSCYSMLVNPTAVYNKFIIEPLREIYEAFVIYTFFSLLTDMLGGAKSIVIMTSGRPPVAHPGFLRFILPKLDISDPRTLLGIKRGILQYVWLKPFICFGVLLSEMLGWYDVNDLGLKSLYLWFTIVYNFSVSLSLYCLAIFWKILWTDLKPFNPVGKFLCVKLIIFASYWQGVLLAVLNFAGFLPGNSSEDENGAPNIGVSIQNALLCCELIAFAFGHWMSFSYKPFTISRMPSGRLRLYYAFKDMIGIKDLVIDFRLTFYGDYYKDYKQFDSVDAMIAHPTSKSRMSRINQGLRYQPNGKQKHWLPSPTIPTAINSDIQSTSEINALPPRAVYADSIYSASSTKGLAPSVQLSPPGSPSLESQARHDGENIVDALARAVPDIDYSEENLDEDELYYGVAAQVVNNYNLDQTEVKQLINYPIVDELVGGHEYGYKVQKLRAKRLQNQLNVSRGEGSSTYGSVN